MNTTPSPQTGKQNFSLGTDYIALLKDMSRYEDRPIARIMRQAIREYAERHHDIGLSHE